MKKINKSIVVFVSIISCLSFSNKPNEDVLVSNYIEVYREIAVVEMHRSGIPASITLAQALHESSNGFSKLATNANNHFGIKCKNYWVGQTYFHKDDDFDGQGNLLESCFRSYDSVLDSYIDHSNFLMMTAHYAPLFNNNKNDYKAWAHGLKNCGYATDARYAEKLISKIEKYNLNQYDSWENPYKSIK